MIYTTGMLFKK